MGANAAGRMSDADLKALEDRACPGAGACGGQYTANTMAMALEFLGLSPTTQGDIPATHTTKAEAAVEIGHMIMDSQRLLDTGQMIFGIVCIGVIGLISDFIFKWANQRLYPWAF